MLASRPEAGTSVAPGSEVTLTVATPTAVDLLALAPEAEWTNSVSDTVPFDGDNIGNEGRVRVVPNAELVTGERATVLETRPDQVATGSITGTFTLPAPIVAGDRFVAAVGHLAGGVGNLTFEVEVEGVPVDALTVDELSGAIEINQDLSRFAAPARSPSGSGSNRRWSPTPRGSGRGCGSRALREAPRRRGADRARVRGRAGGRARARRAAPAAGGRQPGRGAGARGRPRARAARRAAGRAALGDVEPHGVERRGRSRRPVRAGHRRDGRRRRRARLDRRHGAAGQAAEGDGRLLAGGHVGDQPRGRLRRAARADDHTGQQTHRASETIDRARFLRVLATVGSWEGSYYQILYHNCAHFARAAWLAGVGHADGIVNESGPAIWTPGEQADVIEAGNKARGKDQQGRPR
ncbi:hypothetical protein BJF78_17615 [Pseudonocardia sp. CNS-139]|nr:hypothetical protein BJF78_17615 [Pseudonocardia sp. CNS-139]